MKVYFTPAIIFAAVFMVMPAQAREVGDLYVSASGGALFPQDVEVGSDEIKADAVGYHFELSFGGYLTSNLRWELANTYRRYELKDSADGYFGAYVPFANIYYDILDIKNRHDPYIGFGVGIGAWDFHDFRDDDAPTDPEAAFTLNAMAGYNYRINSNLAVGASYRFLYSEPEFFEALLNYKQLHHSFVVTATWAFSDEDSFVSFMEDPIFSRLSDIKSYFVSSNSYVSFSIGPIIHQDTDLDINVPETLTVAGVEVLMGGYEAEVEYDTGFDLNGAFGFFSHPMIRLELAVGFRQWDVDEVADVELSAFNIDAELSATTISFNTYLHFTGKDSTYQPYIGLGLGGLFGKVEAVRGSTKVEASFDNFLVQTFAGYNHRLSDNITIGGSYRFSYSEFKDEDPAIVTEGDLFGHGFLVTFMLGF